MPAQTTEELQNYTLTIAAVSAVLKSLLENNRFEYDVPGLIGNDFAITAKPPDQIKIGEDEGVLLNLFLYQVTPNTRLRTAMQDKSNKPDNQDKSSKSELASNTGAHLLALDMYYLVTAYGSEVFHSDILLGYALQMFQQYAQIEDFREKLADVSGGTDNKIPDALKRFRQNGVMTQVKELEIRPQFLTLEEISKIWSALQARYRPSMAYKVSMKLVRHSA